MNRLKPREQSQNPLFETIATAVKLLGVPYMQDKYAAAETMYREVLVVQCRVLRRPRGAVRS